MEGKTEKIEISIHDLEYIFGNATYTKVCVELGILQVWYGGASVYAYSLKQVESGVSNIAEWSIGESQEDWDSKVQEVEDGLRPRVGRLNLNAPQAGPAIHLIHKAMEEYENRFRACSNFLSALEAINEGI